MHWRGVRRFTCASLLSLPACALTRSFDGFSDRYEEGSSTDSGSTDADSATIDAGGGDGGCIDPRCPILITRGPPKVEERMVVTATDVYWGVEDKTVLKCSLSGCATPSVVSNAEVKIWGFAASADSVFWTNDDGPLGNVRMCGVAGCGTPTSIAKSRGTGIVLDGTRLLWANNEGATGAILGCTPPQCGTPSTFVAIASPKQLSVGSGRIAWGASKAVYTCPLTGCAGAPAPLTTELENIGDVTVDGASVYWATDVNTASVNRCPVAGCAGEPTILANLQAKPRFAIDGTDLYWTFRAASGSIQRCAIGGCSTKPETLASGQTNPKAITLDTGFVYWANDDGSVWKLAKR